jgi:glycosyltransferase involved in cell wall biosynthesis
METKDNIKVSVTFLAYKHAKYLRQCLDSVLCQKVNFNFEIIIADDCSNDGSAEILLEYQRRYPNIVIPIIQGKNLGPRNNGATIQPYIRGEYVAAGESDDYWTDENRLQKQADFLDCHPDYIAVGCNFYNVDPEGRNPYVSMLRWQVNRTYTLKDYKRLGMTIHGNTLMKRMTNIKNDERYAKLWKSAPTMGDIIIRCLLYDQGKIFVLPEVMHAHRMGAQDKTSFFVANQTRAIEMSYMYCNIVDAINEYFDGKHDVSILKANRTGGIILQSLMGHSKLDKKEFKAYMKTLPWNIQLWSYERCIQKLLRGIGHRIGRKLNLFYKLVNGSKQG